MNTGNNVINRMPYLRTTWDFPDDPVMLAETLNRSYLEIAGMVNERTIGIFPANRPAIGGETWFLSFRKQQNLRQIYPFSGAGNIAHGIPLNSVFQFTKCSGSYTDGTNWYGAIYGSNVAIAGQFSFYITPTNIVVLNGGGTPAITDGTIVLEWIVRTSSSN